MNQTFTQLATRQALPPRYILAAKTDIPHVHFPVEHRFQPHHPRFLNSSSKSKKLSPQFHFRGKRRFLPLYGIEVERINRSDRERERQREIMGLSGYSGNELCCSLDDNGGFDWRTGDGGEEEMGLSVFQGTKRRGSFLWAVE